MTQMSMIIFVITAVNTLIIVGFGLAFITIVKGIEERFKPLECENRWRSAVYGFDAVRKAILPSKSNAHAEQKGR